MRTLEERLLETKGQLAQAVSQNEKLTYTLREARDHIAALREEVEVPIHRFRRAIGVGVAVPIEDVTHLLHPVHAHLLRDAAAAPIRG